MIITGLLLASLLVEEKFAAIRADSPGCAVAVSQSERTGFERAYGRADLNLNVSAGLVRRRGALL